MKALSHNEFIEKLLVCNEYYKEGGFEVLGTYISYHNKILIKDKYGELLVTPSKLLNNRKPTILSAIDKDSYIINKFRDIRNESYDYSKVKYVSYNETVIIGCPIHGDFEITVDKFINRVNEGYGCRKCGKKNISKNKILNPTGWSLSNWKKQGLVSKNFDSFKVYIIECWNDKENFYKVGRTFLKVEKRFAHKNMPYNFKLLKIKEGSAEEMFKLELNLKNMFKDFKYIPNHKFSGMFECYNKNIQI